MRISILDDHSQDLAAIESALRLGEVEIHTAGDIATHGARLGAAVSGEPRVGGTSLRLCRVDA